LEKNVHPTKEVRYHTYRKFFSISAFQPSSSEEDDDGVIHTEYLGADPDEPQSESSEEEASEGEEEASEGEEEASEGEESAGEVIMEVQEDVDGNRRGKARQSLRLTPAERLARERWLLRQGEADSEKEQQEKGGESEMQKERQKQKENEKFEVGEFVTAVYEGEWLLAQVDINQDSAGETHVNLNYMEKIGDNKFKWPQSYDLLLTLREDILMKCSAPVLVGSSIRANHVGLIPSEAQEAEAAFAKVVYLQLSTYFTFFYALILVFSYLVLNLDTQNKMTAKIKHKKLLVTSTYGSKKLILDS